MTSPGGNVRTIARTYTSNGEIVVFHRPYTLRSFVIARVDASGEILSRNYADDIVEATSEYVRLVEEARGE